ncbi:MAG: Hydrolase, NUDIX family [Microgenomates group bacterium GW2011_GWC1_39_7b]|uniref:Hydrolase, NUDIX family n=2 Tax=Candidatus Woeseibacteriota TaxID=1752722 RepID=A0A0G0LJY5_9BACT|nr:MAG: Hydrolase, NUDIX family [Candidatus Woesebacteria bacterium GW2011_GWB1_39_10]KKR26933.1 MAG: Hydrolase, NUDIX family [Microgenomates group bacterium GW2011_GWC1_39_7b]KKS91168.1 MAG: Hydrolase, NUDIX family [Candidatus Woesebacteria bacterium GW2011_GWA1_43_12]
MGKNAQQKTTVLREFSSGGVVYEKFKIPDSRFEFRWLVRSTTPSTLFPEKYWTLPKGWLDDESEGIPGPMASGIKKADEKTLRETALREVREEGGVEAKIVGKIGTSTFFYTHPARGKIMKFVTFYLMEYLRNLPEGFDGETSEVAWLAYDEAYKRLSFTKEKEILKKAKDLQ